MVKQQPVIGLKLQSSKRDLRTQINVVSFHTVANLRERLYSALHLTLLGNEENIDQRLHELRELLISHPGRCAVMFHIADRIVRSSVHISVRFSEQLSQQLSKNDLVERVRWR